MNVLVVDVGGTHVKILATGQKQSREFPSGPKLTPKQMVAGVKNLAKDWRYDAIIQSFSHLFLKLTALEISLNFASTNDSQTDLPSLSFSANHYLFPNASFIICRARADNGPIPLPDRNHRPLSTSRQ